MEKEIASNPNDSELHNMLAECIQFREMFKVGALESELVSGANSFLRRPKIDTTPQVEKQFYDEIQKAMELSEAQLKKNPSDTQALYSLGVSYGLRANWSFLVRKAWRDALHDATTARTLHAKIPPLDPNNYDALLVPAAHDYIIGSLPMFYKMLGFLIGYRGDKEKGIRTLHIVASKGKRNSSDAKVFLCAIYRREQRWQEAAPVLDDLIHRYPRNYLMRFERAQMYSALGQKDKALADLHAVADLKRSGAPGFARLPMEQIYYHIGNIQFWYRDWQRAAESLKKATDGGAVLDLNTGTMAWMRLGQVYDMLNQRDLAVAAYKKAINYAPEAEAAKESRRYLWTPYRRQA